MRDQTPDDCPCSCPSTKVQSVAPAAPSANRFATLLAVAFVLIAALASTARGQVCTNDLQGPDDMPGQKDLNQFCALHDACGIAGTHYSWNFDDTSWSGGNTGDACLLFDTDGDGNANRAVCVTVFDGAMMQAGSPK